MKTTKEEARALGNEYGYPVHESGDYFEFHIDKLAALIDEVRGVDAGPVAWINTEDLARMRMAGRGGIVWPYEQKGAHETALYTHPAPSQPAAPVELPVVGDTALPQHALKLADRLPDSEIAYTLRLHLNGLMELPDCSSDAANVAIDKELALRNYPANSANAGRAGWEAARKFKLSDAQAAIAAGRKAS